MNTCLKAKDASNNPISQQLGVTLIESLIAMLIFSLGVLGLTAIQLESLVNSNKSQQRSTVIWKAQELIDRMKANKTIANEYVMAIANQSFNSIGVDDNAEQLNCANIPSPTTFCADEENTLAQNCNTAADQVGYDIWDIFCNPQSGLATLGASGVNTVGVIALEVALKQNTIAADGNDDYLLAFEWLASSTGNIQNITNTETSLCGEPEQQIAPNLDVYCIRFRL